MKKSCLFQRLLRICSAFLIVLMLFNMTPQKVNAASYPMMLHMWQTSAKPSFVKQEGTITLKFSLLCGTYNYEKYHVNIYRGTSTYSSVCVGSTSGYIGNSIFTDLSITWDVSDDETGVYTVEYYTTVSSAGYSFYTSSDGKSTTTVYLVDDYEENACIYRDEAYYRILSNDPPSVCLEQQFDYEETSVVVPSSIDLDGTSYTVTDIDTYAFIFHSDLNRLEIPACVTSIESDIIESNDDPASNITIVGMKGSEAEYFANNRGYTFESKVCTHDEADLTYEPATFSKNGSRSEVCVVCGETISEKTTYKIESVTLSATKLTYNGKNQKPEVIVTNSKGKAISSKYYTVTYPKATKNVGEYTVTVKFKKYYSGSKKLTFSIVPAAPTIEKVKSKSSTITTTWEAASGITGYRIYLYYDGEKISSKTLNAKTTSYQFDDLTSGENYEIRLVAYKKVDDTNYTSKSTKYKTATATGTPKISKITAGSGKAKVTWKDVKGEDGYYIYYSTKKDGTYKYRKAAADATELSVSGLQSGKTYYFKIRSYKETDNGRVYSSYSEVKKGGVIK